jgi:L-ribulose-5-phosphate 3-epimerase UlaE
MHLKDRQAIKPLNVGATDNQIWGKGDTPITEVLQLMRDNSYKFTATIELEYRIPEGSNRVKEVKKCFDYCHKALNS